ncbi:hypothetical protein EXIGLDRAFT_90678 [Exidia glandulosa HHB12029]|uniref:Uncharacterized protein n=1 Tax=Exidia glandulosa HHB12029 TaxID=1314781 RepID=A0A165HCE9_EXIGL|nr:hypothetical protein EXIGLDRAFT_90678 [Exidia glandulosa HHB12029]
MVTCVDKSARRHAPRKYDDAVSTSKGSNQEKVSVSRKELASDTDIRMRLKTLRAEKACTREASIWYT